VDRRTKAWKSKKERKKDTGLWGDEEDSDDEEETMELSTIQEAPSREHTGGPQDK
jgi:hypothetical protein